MKTIDFQQIREAIAVMCRKANTELLLLVSSNDGFRSFYRSTAGFVVICIGAAMATLGWKLITAIGRLPEDPRVLGSSMAAESTS